MNDFRIHHFPGSKILLPFLFGILVYIHFLHLPIIITAAAFCFFLMMYAVFVFLNPVTNYTFRWIHGVLLAITLFFAGMLISFLQDDFHKAFNISQQYQEGDRIVGYLEETPQERENSFRGFFVVKEIYRNDQIIPCSGKMLLYFKKDLAQVSAYSAGQYLLISAKVNRVEPPKNPDQFNYQKYLYLHQIYQTSFVDSNHLTTLNQKEKNIFIWSTQCRDYISNLFIKNGIQGQELSVAAAILLGEKKYLDSDLTAAYVNSGTIHVLAVSGMHVGILFLIIQAVFNLIDRKNRFKMMKTVSFILLLWGYAFLTGLSASVVRAVVMFTVFLIGKASNQKNYIENTICISAFLILLVNPFFIKDIGFQLSYLAVIGIVWIHPWLFGLITPYVSFLGKYFNYLLHSIWLITSISISAQIMTFPISILYFHQFPNYFVLTNLLIIPLSTLVLYIGCIFVAGASFIPILGIYLAKIWVFFIKLLNGIALFSEKLPFALTKDIFISPLEAIALYTALFSILFFWMYRRVPFLFASMISIIILLISFIIHDVDTIKNREFLVYNVPKTTFIQLNHYPSSTLITYDSSGFSRGNYFAKEHRIKHYFPQADTLYLKDQPNSIKSHVLYYKGCFFFENKSLFILNKNNMAFWKSLKDKIGFDAVIIQGDLYASAKVITNSKSNFFLMDGNVNTYKADKWEQILHQEQKTFYNTNLKGAFVWKN